MFIVIGKLMPTDMAEHFTDLLTRLWNPNGREPFGKEELAQDLADSYVDYVYSAEITDGVVVTLILDNMYSSDRVPDSMTLKCDDTQFVAKQFSACEYSVEIVTPPAPGWKKKERLIKEQWFELFRRNCFLFGYEIPSTEEERAWWEFWYREERATREERARNAPVQLSLWPQGPSQVAQALSPL